MNEEYFDFFDERVSRLEKDVDVLVDWLEEISPDLRKANQRKEAYGLHDKNKN